VDRDFLVDHLLSRRKNRKSRVYDKIIDEKEALAK